MLNHNSGLVRYGVALLTTLLTLAIKLALVPLATRESPFLLFFASVMIAARFGGLGPGVAATALATIANVYVFMRPPWQFQLSTIDQWTRLVMFCAEGTFISIICAHLKASRERAERSEQEARQLERRILEISDAEQRRIGNDLHDGLGQHLTGVALLARHVEQHCTATSASIAADAVKLASLAKSAVGFAHDLCRTLSPPALERSGLAEALHELACHAETLFSIECIFESSAAEYLVNLEVGGHLYRIAQEAISNAVKHGGASQVCLSLDQDGEQLRLEIIDNGKGFSPAEAENGGMGLRTMKYRARMIGADINFTRRDSGGTIVRCSLPHIQVAPTPES